MHICRYENKIGIGVAMLVWFIINIHVSCGQNICNMSGEDLMACKPSVTPPPSAKCCSALSHADFRCLCSYKNSKLLPSLGINLNLAQQLPHKCKLPHPSHC